MIQTFSQLAESIQHKRSHIQEKTEQAKIKADTISLVYREGRDNDMGNDAYYTITATVGSKPNQDIGLISLFIRNENIVYKPEIYKAILGQKFTSIEYAMVELPLYRSKDAAMAGIKQYLAKLK